MHRLCRIIHKGESGSSFIELIVIVVIIGTLSVIATAGLLDYSRTSKLNAAAYDLITVLNVAKSNSFSQVKDSSLCTPTDILNGYKVTINDSTSYDLYVVCGGIDHKIANTKYLGENIVFSSSTPASFFFPVLTGGVVGFGSIVLSGHGRTKTVVIDSGGIIR